MTNKFVIIGAGAAVVKAIIVVLSFIQNQNDRAVAEAAYHLAHVKNLCDEMASDESWARYNYTWRT